MINKFKLLTATAVLAFLTACGGGGGGGGGATTTVASTNAFDVSSGYRRLVSTGFQKTFTLSGSCSGSATNTDAPATTPANFDGTNGFSAVSVITGSYTNCTPASFSSTSIKYYDTNYIPIGEFYTSHYILYSSKPILPSSARIGDAGIVASANIYTDSTKSVKNGKTETSYVIEADTVTTAILNLITKSYTEYGILTSTEQDRYRVSADGTLTFLSFDLQQSGTSTLRLIGN